MWSQVGLRNITRNKGSGGDGIPVELFQILKDDAVKVLHSICQQILKTQQRAQDWKVSFHVNPKERQSKECSNYRTITFISHASKVMLKILQAGLQQYVNWKLPDIQAGFRKGRRNRSSCQHPLNHIKSKRIPEKKIYFCFIDEAKVLTVWIKTNCGKFFKRWEYQTILPVSWEMCMQVKRQHLDKIGSVQGGMNGWVPPLFTWNCHIFVNWLCLNRKCSWC